MPLDATRAATLLRQLADEITRKTPGNTFCAELASKARTAADHLDASRAPPVRFFARIEAVTLECPVCTTMLRCGEGHKGSAQWWDKTTARLKCPGCGRVSVLGTIAWPVLPGVGRLGRQGVSEDQLPNDRQRAALRQQLRGVWAAARLVRHPMRTNVRMDEGCTCLPGAVGAGGEGCPIHQQREEH